MTVKKLCFKSELQRAVLSFNSAEFFECHEIIEALWMTLKPNNPLRLFLQGWLQIAVGFYHWQRSNSVGARNLLLAGLLKLDTHALEGNAWVTSYDWLTLSQEANVLLDVLLTAQGKALRLEVLPVCQFPKLEALNPAKE